MYKKFYGFKEKPFQLVPNPRFLYLSKKHQNALTHLEYGLSEGSGFILLTGDIGSGKTTIIRHILNRIEGNDKFEVGVISSTNVDSGELLGLVMQEFGIEATAENKAKSLDAIYRYLIKEFARGRRVLLVIDEAQNLSIQALEEIRMLSKLQTDDQMLVQIILVGQPELKRRLNSAALTQLSQRISVFYHLGALDRDEIKRYVAFRLEKAGGSREIFTVDTFDLIFLASGGIPRIINILCDTALVYGYADSLKTINATVLAQVIRDKEGLGLMTNEPQAEEAAPVGEKAADDAPRLLALEEKVAKLQQQLSGLAAEIGRQDKQANERLVTELTGLLRDEREKTDRLLLEFSKLKTGVGMQISSPPLSEAAEGGEELQQQDKFKKDTSKDTNNWFQRIVQGLT